MSTTIQREIGDPKSPSRGRIADNTGWSPTAGGVVSVEALRLRVLAIVLMLASACISCAGSGPSSVRRSALGITPPCSLRSCGMYKDGGSIGGVLVGNRGEVLKFLLPRKLWIGGRSRDRAGYRAWEAAPRPVYIGSDRPGDPVAKPLEVGSRVERAFIDMLREAAARDTSTADPRRPAARLALSVVHVLETNKPGLPPPSLDDWWNPR